MPEQEHTDDIEDGIDRSDLRWIQSAIVRANDQLGSALGQSVSFLDTDHPAYDIGRVHTDLIEAYGAVCRAIDAAEQTIDNSDYDQKVPVQIKNEHGDRVKENYDGEVLNLALMLLEWNRRKWLHQKPDTQGADTVRRHGLTANQREWLNQLQDLQDGRIEVVDEARDTVISLRGEAEELREREDFDDHLESVAEQLEHRADRLEGVLGGDSSDE